MVGWEDFAVSGESEAHLLRELNTKGTISKPGRDAKHPTGISYVGPWETMHDGVASAVRRHSAALRASGLPVFLQSESHTHANLGVTTTVDYSTLPEAVLDEVGHMTQLDHADTAVVIRHTVPTQQMLEGIVMPSGARFMSAKNIELYRARTVLYAAFEENKIPEQRVNLLNLLGNIWVPSLASKVWLQDSGVQVPIQVIPHPFDERDPMGHIKPKKRGSVFRFLNVSKWEPRKAQHDLIGGFLLAFGPQSPVELVLKCNPYMRCADYPEDANESIREWLKVESVQDNGWEPDNVEKHVRVIWNKIVSRQTLAQMYAESDVYVSCGRSEGFDMPAFDAKLACRRLVHADSGAPYDYRACTDIEISHHRRVKFHPWYQFPEATWPDFDAIDVAEALFAAYNTKTEVQPLDREFFTQAAVGLKMREACIELAPELAEVRA
jgi:hypothetical protein